MNLSYRFYYVWKRNLISYKRFVLPTLLVSLGEPLFYLVAMGIGLGAYLGGFGGKGYLDFLASGLIISSVMIASAFECLYGSFVRMVHEKLYDSLIVTPISAEDAVAGDIVWGAFRGLVSGVLMLLVAFAIHALSVPSAAILFLLPLMVITGLLFASASMIITSFAPNFDFFNYYTELVITPMFFFSGVFFPLDKMPEWVKTLSLFFPLTHAVNISRVIFFGTFTPILLLNMSALVFLTGILFYMALFFMKRRLIK